MIENRGSNRAEGVKFERERIVAGAQFLAKFARAREAEDGIRSARMSGTTDLPSWLSNFMLN